MHIGGSGVGAENGAGKNQRREESQNADRKRDPKIKRCQSLKLKHHWPAKEMQPARSKTTFNVLQRISNHPNLLPAHENFPESRNLSDTGHDLEYKEYGLKAPTRTFTHTTS